MFFKRLFKSKEKNRVAEVWDSCRQEWVRIKFKNIKKNSLFILFEPDNMELVKTKSGYSVFWADSDAYLIEGTDLFQVKYSVWN